MTEDVILTEQGEALMRRICTVATLALALAAVPAIGFGFTPSSPNQAAASAKSKPSKTTVATQTTSGVVKSVDESKLVITRAGKKPGDMTFMLNGSTHRAGTIEPGARVSIRYTVEQGSNLAAAVTAQAPKTASKKPASKPAAKATPKAASR